MKLSNLNKKDVSILVILVLVAIGALIADGILIYRVLEHWKELISASVLSGAAVGGAFLVYKYIQKKSSASQ